MTDQHAPNLPRRARACGPHTGAALPSCAALLPRAGASLLAGAALLSCAPHAPSSTAATATAGASSATEAHAPAEAHATADADASSTPPSPRGSREEPACAATRKDILAAMDAARTSTPCAADTDCAAVTGPGHWAGDFKEIVPAAQATAFDARSRAHLASCGAFHTHDPAAGFTVIRAVCANRRCGANHTSVSGSDP